MKFGGMVGKYKGIYFLVGFFNVGEKVIYWLLIVFGIFVVISGLVFDFLIFG